MLATWADIDGVHFNHSGQLIKMVRMKGDGAVLWSLQRGTVLSWDLKGPDIGVHKWEGDAGNTWKSREMF